MQRIERQRVGIDYLAIADAYGYKPVPDGFEEPASIDVCVDWEAGADEMNKIKEDIVANFLSGDNKVDDSIELPTNVGMFNLKIEASTHPIFKTKNLYIFLENEQGEQVAQFLISKKHNDDHWDLYDRFTHEGYRGKGIGTKLLQFTEEIVKAYGDEARLDQVVEMNASQLPVLSMFLRMGYEITDEDERRFIEVMDSLKQVIQGI